MAADVADRLAYDLHEIRPELQGKKYAILVTNVDGEVVHRAHLDTIVLPPAPLPN